MPKNVLLFLVMLNFGCVDVQAKNKFGSRDILPVGKKICFIPGDDSRLALLVIDQNSAVDADPIIGAGQPGELNRNIVFTHLSMKCTVGELNRLLKHYKACVITEYQGSVTMQFPDPKSDAGYYKIEKSLRSEPCIEKVLENRNPGLN